MRYKGVRIRYDGAGGGGRWYVEREVEERDEVFFLIEILVLNGCLSLRVR